MAGGCKSAKTELVAIYQLQFYRKQNNWKFCRKEKLKQADDNKDESPKPDPKSLNQTYRVEARDNNSLLNKAFLGPVNEEDDSPDTGPPKKSKESLPKAFKRRNKASKASMKDKKCSRDTIDTPKHHSNNCKLQQLQNERNTKVSNKCPENSELEKAPKDIVQDSPRPRESPTENDDGDFKTCVKQLEPQTVISTDKSGWLEGTAQHRDNELDGSQTCKKKKKFIWASSELNDQESIEDNYHYEVQTLEVMEQPLWFQELAKQAYKWPESYSNIQPWPEMDQNCDYDVRYSPESHNFDQRSEADWIQPDVEHDSKGWQHWTKQSDKQDVQYINNWQQISQNFNHSPPRQETYTDSKQQDVFKHLNHLELQRFVENQPEVRQNLDKMLQSFEKIPQNFDDPQKPHQNYGNVESTAQYYREIQPLLKNLLEGQIAPQTPLDSLQSRVPGEDPCLYHLPEMDPVGCEGCEADWPLQPSPWKCSKETDAIWSEDVLRELEALEMLPPLPAESRAGGAARGGRWVRPERLLEWLLTKEPAGAGDGDGEGEGGAPLDSSDSSGASADEFMRGAHCNPHSTELSLDLEPPPPPPPRGLARRPTAALRARGAAHARALHALACEIRARESIVRGKEILSSRALANHPHHNSETASSEELPTRDLGLHASPDAFLSGSHRNNPHALLYTPRTGNILHQIGDINDDDGAGNENGANCEQVNILFHKITAALKSQCNEGSGQKELTEAGNFKGIYRVTPATLANCDQKGVNCSESGANCNGNFYGNKRNTRDFKVKEINNNEVQFDCNEKMFSSYPNPGYNNNLVYNQNGVKSKQTIINGNNNEWGKINEKGVNVNERGVHVNGSGVKVDDFMEINCSMGRGRGRFVKESCFGAGRGRGHFVTN